MYFKTHLRFKYICTCILNEESANHCVENVDNFHTNWSKTAGSTLATVECTGQYTGSASRYCGSDGKWQEPNYSNCTSNSIVHIKEEVNPVYTMITSVFHTWGISFIYSI